MAYDILVPYSFSKNGIYYFERRVPRDLRKHYTSNKIAYSLRTPGRTRPVSGTVWSAGGLRAAASPASWERSGR